MDKNTITGIVLMGLLLFGFTFYQNKQYQKQAAYQAQLDSIALVKQRLDFIRSCGSGPDEVRHGLRSPRSPLR